MFFEWRTFLEKGILPRDGGLSRQHPLYVAAMGALMSEEGAILEEERREQQQRAAAQSGPQ